MPKVSYMCGSVLSEYLGTGNDKDEKYLTTIFVRENISCATKMELTYTFFYRNRFIRNQGSARQKIKKFQDEGCDTFINLGQVRH